MLESMYIGATGMHAQQTNMDVIANNLANVNTAGYKKNRVEFEDLMYRAVPSARALLGSGEGHHLVGIGSAVSDTTKVFSLGKLKGTDNPLDVAIQGQGFLEVVLPDESLGYSRSGSLRVNENGVLSTADGYAVNPLVQVPADATELVIQPDGKVLAAVPGEQAPIEIGAIELARFVNPNGLAPRGDNVYVPSRDAGQVYYGIPGEDGFGALAQGYLESSNVDLTEELVNLILAQRAYEINSRVVQASDEVLSLANNMRR